MRELLDLFWGTGVLRPYVFVFLAAHLWSGVAAFNLLITFGIGEVPLGLAGLTIVGTLAALLAAGDAAPLPGRAARAYHREISGP